MAHMGKLTYTRIRLSSEEIDYLLEALPPPSTRVGFSVMAKLMPDDEEREPQAVAVTGPGVNQGWYAEPTQKAITMPIPPRKPSKATKKAAPSRDLKADRKALQAIIDKNLGTAETCAARLQPESSYTRLTPVCGKPAKGHLPDGTPACGIHLRSLTAILMHDEEEEMTKEEWEAHLKQYQPEPEKGPEPW